MQLENFWMNPVELQFYTTLTLHTISTMHKLFGIGVSRGICVLTRKLLISEKAIQHIMLTTKNNY